jgi:phage tail P2-like protein
MSNKEDVIILDVAPSSIKTDQQVLDMCEAIQPELNSVNDLIPEIDIYGRIDELPEPILRMLALEHRVYQDEWNLAKTIEAKRELVKNSFLLNQRRGTRWSIERIFDLLNITATIQEWFDYGGDPFSFRISIYDIEDRGLTNDELETAYRLVNRYKPLRSTIESVDISVKLDDVNAYTCAFVTTNIVIDIEPDDDVYTVETNVSYFAGTSGTMNIISNTYPMNDGAD